MALSFLPLNSYQEYTGKRVKWTEKLITWSFMLQGEVSVVRLIYNVLKGSLKIIVNGVLQVCTKKIKANTAEYPVYLGSKVISIKQFKKEFDLEVGHVSFQLMVKQMKEENKNESNPRGQVVLGEFFKPQKFKSKRIKKMQSSNFFSSIEPTYMYDEYHPEINNTEELEDESSEFSIPILLPYRSLFKFSEEKEEKTDRDTKRRSSSEIERKNHRKENFTSFKYREK